MSVYPSEAPDTGHQFLPVRHEQPLLRARSFYFYFVLFSRDWLASLWRLRVLRCCSSRPLSVERLV